MSLLSYGAFFCCLVGVTVTVLSLYLNPRTPLNQSVALLGAGYAVYAFGSIWIYGSPNLATVWFFYHLACVGTFFLLPVSGFIADLQFAQVSTRTALLVSLPFILFWAFVTGYLFNHNVVYQSFRATPVGNAGVLSGDTAWIVALLGVSLVQTVISFALMLRARRRTMLKRVRSLISVWFVVNVCLMVVTAIEQELTRAFGLPSLDLFEGLLNCGLLFYLVVHFRYLRIGGATLEREIIRAMKEAIVLVEPDLRIRNANAITQAIFSVELGELPSRTLESLFDDAEAMRGAWESAVASRTTTEITGASVHGSDVEVVLAPSFDQFGDLVGGVVLVRKEDVFGSVLSQYGITARERDVVQLLLQGYDRRKIAEMQFIAPSTVKNHIHSIYEKTGVSNRVELLLLFSDGK